jgi:hypothetical protein
MRNGAQLKLETLSVTCHDTNLGGVLAPMTIVPKLRRREQDPHFAQQVIGQARFR